jgi:hypothetical protein
MQNLTINPTFHDLIPPISTEEYKLLEESILQDGCREKIITWDGCILDGHNRYEICQQHDIRFGIHEMCFENETEAKIWIIRNQLARRNLPQHERIRLALLLKPAIEEKAKEHQREAGGAVLTKSSKPPVHTRKEVAAVAGVSEDTIRKSEIIENEASPEVKDAARKGKISVNKAYKKTKKTPHKITTEKRPPDNGLRFAKMAIMDLEKILENDLQYDDGLALVKQWIEKHERRK